MITKFTDNVQSAQTNLDLFYFNCAHANTTIAKHADKLRKSTETKFKILERGWCAELTLLC